ncbi:uncharacterized protein K452DRAFT_356306 [Aplosporella prunicola CBS 121167]|uniref:Cytochrome P450 n=1 Tax=Aplosporella prunicola CBS 121167 TaxID=1176127 RepID=A0A6A6BLG8_9PEZI|nr:uncharacterized protein K452DRAFT_356306 [Aplosporella prunicola CBS 121167]KAF2144960.1 hypothetical protein K452DRAFT_356306 [Aplosporella prunicola CBS 121167]
MKSENAPITLYVISSFIIGSLTYLIHRLLKIGSRPSNLPPGPPTSPIWGNLKQLSNVIPQKQYREWSKEYGPVFTIMSGSEPYVVVNEAKAAHHIFVKNGLRTAARPDPRLNLILRGGYFPSLMSGADWLKARKMWQSILTVGASKQYLPYQDLEAKKLLFDVLEDANHWRNHIERFSNSIAMTMTNGHRVPASDNPLISEVIEDLQDWVQLTLKAWWLPSYPMLFKLPNFLIPVLNKARKVGKYHKSLVMRLYNLTKQRVAEGMVLPSFNQSIQEKVRQNPGILSEAEGAEIGMALLTAATDTTAASLVNWFAAMANYPEAQRKAREEIDRVVGPNRLPREEDGENLPYVRQVVQETERWLTVAPLGLFHATTAPVEYNEWEIPAGTGLILNTYAIHKDADVYPSPQDFLPERWEGKLETAAEDSLGAKSEHFAFGAGRRICPGQYLAERSLFLVMSHVLWAFEISKARDADGNEVPVDTNDLRPGAVATINPFRVTVKPRSEKKVALVRRIWEEEREALLDEDEQWRESPEGVARLMSKVK